MSSNGENCASQFFKMNTKTVTIPSGIDVIIKKINPLSFLSVGGLPTAAILGADKKMGNMKKMSMAANPKEKLMEMLISELDKITDEIEKCTDTEVLESLIDQHASVEKKLSKHTQEQLNTQQSLNMVVLREGLESPKLSNIANIVENKITINDLSPQDINFLVREISSFSGYAAEGAEASKSFRNEPKESNMSRQNGDEVRSNPVELSNNDGK